MINDRKINRDIGVEKDKDRYKKREIERQMDWLMNVTLRIFFCVTVLSLANIREI